MWELYYYNVIEPSGKTLLFPELRSVGKAFMNAFTVNGFGAMVAHSMQLMLKGLLIGVILALIFSSLAVVSDTFYAIYNMIVSHKPRKSNTVLKKCFLFLGHSRKEIQQ